MSWTLDGRFDNVSDDRYIKLERSSVGLEIRVKKISDDSLLGKITVPTADLPAFHSLLMSCCR